MKTCKHCGATLSQSETKFEDIIGQEHAKRALEVALAGGHSITFFGNREAEALAEWAKAHGLTAWAMPLCPCGYYGFQTVRECTCSLSQISKWQKRKAFQNALRAEIVIECPPAYPYQIENWASGRKGESENAMLTRVEAKGESPEPKLDGASQSLLRAAIKQLPNIDADNMLRLAQTIAALAKDNSIKTHHLAEAIQYRPRRY